MTDPAAHTPEPEDEWKPVYEKVEPHALCCKECRAARDAHTTSDSAGTPDVDALVETVKAGIFGGPGPVSAALSDLAATARKSEARAEAAEADRDRQQELLDQLEATMTAEEPKDHVFRFFQRLHGLPETGAPKHRRVADLEAALTGLESAARILDVMLREPAAEGLMSAEDYRAYVQGAWLGVDEAAERARAALAGDGGGA